MYRLKMIINYVREKWTNKIQVKNIFITVVSSVKVMYLENAVDPCTAQVKNYMGPFICRSFFQ